MRRFTYFLREELSGFPEESRVDPDVHESHLITRIPLV